MFTVEWQYFGLTEDLLQKTQLYLTCVDSREYRIDMSTLLFATGVAGTLGVCGLVKWLMGEEGALDGGVTAMDLREAENRINTEHDLNNEDRRRNVGVSFNSWRKPVCKFGPGEGDLKEKLFSLACIGKFEIDQRDWERARIVVDEVLDLLLQEIRAIVITKDYELLSIQGYVRQGSSREGLKVAQADEFDTILQFDIEGVSYEVEPIKDQPGLGLIRVSESMNSIKKKCPTLWKNGAFVTLRGRSGECYLSSMNVYQKIFLSLISRAADSLSKKINSSEAHLSFSITRRMNPPSVNITINFTVQREDGEGRRSFLDRLLHLSRNKMYKIDVDIVPALLVPMDTPTQSSKQCPRYAVSKWFEESQMKSVDPSMHTWRICSSGYEKHILDECLFDDDRMFFVTADRVVKAYFRKAKETRKEPPRLVTVLSSYHLKTITFYCILFLCIINKKQVNGVREALAYFLLFLKISLEEKRLPDFFLGNEHIIHMFPNYDYKNDSLKVDMFQKFHNSIDQTLSSFQEMVRRLSVLNLPDVVEDYPVTYRGFIKSGEYANDAKSCVVM